MFAISVKNSYFLRGLIKLGGLCYRIKLYLARIYSDTYVDKLIKAFWCGTKINFKNSFIIRASDIGFKDYSFILKNSKFANWLFALHKICKISIIDYKAASVIVTQAVTIKKELMGFSVKTEVISMVAAVFANLFFSFLLGKKIMILQWFIQLSILFISMGIIVSSFKWKVLKEGSAVIRYINRYCKI